jgi:hypothetical protein
MRASVYYVRDERFASVQTDILRGLYRPDPSHYKFIVAIEAKDLEDVFRQMNNVDGTELPAKLKIRSLSVGDVAVVNGAASLCMPTGWQRIDDPFLVPGLSK